MPDTSSPVNVAVLAFPEATASVVFGMYDLFLSAGRDWGLVVEGHPGPSLLRPTLASARHGAFAAGNGVWITPEVTLDRCPPPDIVCVPEVQVAPGESLDGRLRAEIEWLKHAHAAGATVATACSGALLLAEAGLLDGQDATTHWGYCETLARRYPKVRVHAQRALVVSGEGQRLVMAGGGTSWLDLVLYLIGRYAGPDVAMQTARINLIDWHAVGQLPFARLARSRQVDDAVIAECQVWIADNYARPAPVAAMARRSGLSERSFKRRFRQATGMSPLEYVHTLRMEEAKQMLEAGDQPIEAIANDVGYEDPGFFGRLFRRKVNLTPGEYRRRFGSMRRAVQTADGRTRHAGADGAAVRRARSTG